AGVGPGRFEPVTADVSQLGSWLDGADVVCGRAVLHHIPMAEATVGRLRTRVRRGTRVGFVEPDFRGQVARLAYLEATGRPELAPLRVWLTVMNDLYHARRISPAVGATLGVAMEAAGYQRVRSVRVECPSDASVIDNMVMCYDEIRDTIGSLGILTAAQVNE